MKYEVHLYENMDLLLSWYETWSLIFEDNKDLSFLAERTDKGT